MNHFLYLNINLGTIFTYALLECMRLCWEGKRILHKLLSTEILTDFSTTLVHLKSKTAEPSREIKE